MKTCLDGWRRRWRLETKCLRYERAELPEIGLTQLFVVDPNNVLLELNFRT